MQLIKIAEEQMIDAGQVQQEIRLRDVLSAFFNLWIFSCQEESSEAAMVFIFFGIFRQKILWIQYISLD